MGDWRRSEDKHMVEVGLESKSPAVFVEKSCPCDVAGAFSLADW